MSLGKVSVWNSEADREISINGVKSHDEYTTVFSWQSDTTETFIPYSLSLSGDMHWSPYTPLFINLCFVCCTLKAESVLISTYSFMAAQVYSCLPAVSLHPSLRWACSGWATNKPRQTGRFHYNAITLHLFCFSPGKSLISSTEYGSVQLVIHKSSIIWSRGCPVILHTSRIISYNPKRAVKTRKTGINWSMLSHVEVILPKLYFECLIFWTLYVHSAEEKGC